MIVAIKNYTEHHNWNSQSKPTSYTINIIAAIQLNSLHNSCNMGTSDLPDMYAQILRAALVPMLELSIIHELAI